MFEKYEKLRAKKGVTDYQVCKETGIAPSSMSDWRSGRYELKIDKLKKLADYFGVSIEYFVGK